LSLRADATRRPRKTQHEARTTSVFAEIDRKNAAVTMGGRFERS
jgi:hypothetical protein